MRPFWGACEFRGVFLMCFVMGARLFVFALAMGIMHSVVAMKGHVGARRPKREVVTARSWFVWHPKNDDEATIILAAKMRVRPGRTTTQEARRC